MVKPYMSIKLKDPQHYYLEDETIVCVMDLRLEKVLKDAILKVSFKGRSSSHSNGSRNHFETIFTTEKEISIFKWNTAANLKKMCEVEFSVEVPNGVTIPSYRNLEGSDGGKIEYMIEGSLETAGFLKKSVQASHIIQVPLIGKINVAENGLQRTRESTICWPKNEENANTCVLSAWIPHEGCVRGKDVPVRVEFKQPDRYQPAKSVWVELIRQEIIASTKDKLPDMTKQLEDKVIQKDEKPIVLSPEIGANRLLTSSQVLVVSTPSNITPTINANAKVMRLDYKLRVSVQVFGIDSGKDKTLSVNLPIVIGTTGASTIYDSGFELLPSNNPFGQGSNNGSEGNGSINNGFGGGGAQRVPSGYYSAGASVHNNSGFGMGQPLIVGGFHMPDPNYGYPPPVNQGYPPPNRFVLNPQQLAYTDQNNDGSNKFEGMPMPDFGNNRISIHGDQSSLSSSPTNTTTITSAHPDRTSQISMYPPAPYAYPDNTTSKFGYPPPSNNHNKNDYIQAPPSFQQSIQKPLFSEESEKNNNDSGDNIRPLSPLYPPEYDATNSSHALDSAFDNLYLAASPILKTSPSSENNSVTIPFNSIRQSLNKPNTPTPPQTPSSNHRLSKHRPAARPNEGSSTSTYHSTLLVPDSHTEDTVESEAAALHQNKIGSIAARIDPLDKVDSSP